MSNHDKLTEELNNFPHTKAAYSARFFPCDCGCSTIRLYCFDKKGKIITYVAYSAEQWFLTISELVAVEKH